MMLLQVVQVPAPPAPVIVPDVQVLPPWMMMDPKAIVMICIAFFLLLAIVFYPLMRALGRRLEGRAGDEELRREVDELRARVAQLEGEQAHVAELEERLNFAERLLANARPPERIGGGPMP